MLLIILLGIMSTLAIAQGMLLLFLIRSRGHMLALSSEVMNLQSRLSTVAATEAQLKEVISTQSDIRLQLKELEVLRVNQADLKSNKGTNIIRLAAVGS